MILILLLTLTTIVANAISGPYPTWLEQITGSIAFYPSGESYLPSPNQEKVYPAHVARWVYDVATDGGSIGSHTLETQLPANAVIIKSWYKHVTQFDGGGGTVAIKCEDANNIVSAIDLDNSSTAGAIYNGAVAPGTTAGNFTDTIDASCYITATVASTAQSAGKLIGWVEYVVAD